MKTWGEENKGAQKGMKVGDEGPDWEWGKEPRGDAESNRSGVNKGRLICKPWKAVAKGGSLEISCRGLGSRAMGGAGELSSGRGEDEAGLVAAQRV
jgi:hypothetical protein